MMYTATSRVSKFQELVNVTILVIEHQNAFFQLSKSNNTKMLNYFTVKLNRFLLTVDCRVAKAGYL